MMRIWMLALVTVTLTACGGSAKRSHDLDYDVRLYNEGVRWANLPQAAIRILPSQREDFLNEREELEEELRIDDFEIMRLKMEGDSQETAKVQIKWTWHMDREGIVKSTTSRQDWRRYGSRWIMLKEAHLRGDEMPGIKHKVEDSDADEGEEEELEGEPKEVAPAEDAAVETSVSAKAARHNQVDRSSKARTTDVYRQVQGRLRVAEKTQRIAE